MCDNFKLNEDRNNKGTFVETVKVLPEGLNVDFPRMVRSHNETDGNQDR